MKLTLIPRLLSILSLAAPLTSFCTGNLAQNPSFETTRLSGLPSDWGTYFPDVPSNNPLQLAKGTVSMFSTDTSSSHDGTRSLKIFSASPVRAAAHQRNLPCLPGQKWRFSVWMRGKGLSMGDNQGAWARLAFSHSSDPVRQRAAFARSVYLKSTQSTFDWQCFEIDAEVPPEADSMIVELYLWNSQGTAWFDDVSVEFLSGPANPAEAQADPNDLARYRAANLALGAPAAGQRRVVFIGDSITHKWDLATFFPGDGFINRGISGQHSSQILGRFQDDVIRLSPRVVYIMAGRNDLAGGVTPEIVASNIREAVRLCRDNDIRVIVASVLPVSDYHADKNPAFKRTTDRAPELLHELNTRLQSLCREESNATFLDLYNLVVDANDRMPADFANDGLHPSAACYKVLAPAVRQAVQAALIPTP